MLLQIFNTMEQIIKYHIKLHSIMVIKTDFFYNRIHQLIYISQCPIQLLDFPHAQWLLLLQTMEQLAQWSMPIIILQAIKFNL